MQYHSKIILFMGTIKHHNIMINVKLKKTNNANLKKLLNKQLLIFINYLLTIKRHLGAHFSEEDIPYKRRTVLPKNKNFKSMKDFYF